MINEEKFSQISDSKSSLVFEYENKDEFKQYLLELPQKLRYKVVSKIELIVQYGLVTSMQKELVKKIEDNLYEIRVSGEGIFSRSFFFRLEDNKPQQTCIILSSFKKKTNQTPIREIEKAKAKRANYLNKKRL